MTNYTYKNETHEGLVVGSVHFEPGEIKSYPYINAELDKAVSLSILTRYIDNEFDEAAPLNPLEQHQEDHKRIKVNPSLPGEPNGFIDRTQVGMTWDDATRTLTLTPIGAYFEIWSDGVRYLKYRTETIQIPDVEGNVFVYYDSKGILSFIPSFDIEVIIKYAFVASMYWNAIYKKTVPGVIIELHSCEFPAHAHPYLHTTRGTVYQGGLKPSIITEADGSLITHAQADCSTGIIWDEDLKHIVPSLTKGDTLKVMYREGATGTWTYDNSVALVLTTGSGRASYNQWTGATWQKTEVGNNNFVLMHLYAFPGIVTKWMVIMGEGEYLNQNTARDGAHIEAEAIAGLPIIEYKLVASFLLQTSSTYTNSVKSRLRETIINTEQYVDWRLSSKLVSE